MAGRPTKYTDAIANTICARIADGESLRTICKSAGMPGRQTVLGWLSGDDHEDFRTKYARAREAQADFLAEEILELADKSRIGEKKTTKADGSVEVVEGDMVERARLQIDARKWYAAKLAPKKYGERTTLAGDPENPLAVLTMEQIAANPASRLKV